MEESQRAGRSSQGSLRGAGRFFRKGCMRAWQTTRASHEARQAGLCLATSQLPSKSNDVLFC